MNFLTLEFPFSCFVCMFFFALFDRACRVTQGHDGTVRSICVLKIYRYLIDAVYIQMLIVLKTRARCGRTWNVATARRGAVSVTRVNTYIPFALQSIG